VLYGTPVTGFLNSKSAQLSETWRIDRRSGTILGHTAEKAKRGMHAFAAFVLVYEAQRALSAEVLN
jgi:hypothetical protein